MNEVCHVCGKPLDELYAVTCMSCGRKIHFPAVESAGDDCGSIVTELYACALAFVCKCCSEQQQKKF
jgi:hypothetical protein